MKVVNTMFLKSLGGIENSFLIYNKLFQLLNFEVTDFVNGDGKVIKEIENVAIERFYNTRWYNFITIYKIGKKIAEIKPDVIFVHGVRPMQMIKKAIFTLKFRITKMPKLVMICHNSKIQQKMIGCDAMLCVNEKIRNKIIEMGQNPESVFVIPNAISQDNIEIKPSKSQISTIGILSRLAPEKAIHNLLEAVKLLKNDGIPYQIKIAGDGIERQALELTAKGLNVEFLGWIKNKNEFFNNIDIFCFPSHEESFGISLIEAMSYGKAVVSTATDGAMSILKDNHNGLIVKINDIKDLYEKLKFLILNSEVKDRIGKNALKDSEIYNIKNVKNKIKEVIEYLKNEKKNTY